MNNKMALRFVAMVGMIAAVGVCVLADEKVPAPADGKGQDVWPVVIQLKNISADSFVDTLRQLAKYDSIGDAINDLPIAVNREANAVVIIGSGRVIDMIVDISRKLDVPSEYRPADNLMVAAGNVGACGPMGGCPMQMSRQQPQCQMGKCGQCPMMGGGFGMTNAMPQACPMPGMMPMLMCPMPQMQQVPQMPSSWMMPYGGWGAPSYPMPFAPNAMWGYGQPNQCPPCGPMMGQFSPRYQPQPPPQQQSGGSMMGLLCQPGKSAGRKTADADKNNHQNGGRGNCPGGQCPSMSPASQPTPPAK